LCHNPENAYSLMNYMSADRYLLRLSTDRQ